MKTMAFLSALFALFLSWSPVPTDYAIALWVYACGWALLMLATKEPTK